MSRAYKLSKQALTLATELNMPDQRAQAQRTNAIASLSIGLVAEAFEMATQARRTFHTLGDTLNEAVTLNTLGFIYDYLGDHDNRLNVNLRSLQLREENGDRDGTIRSMNNTADTYLKLGQWEMAVPLLKKCLRWLGNSKTTMVSIVHCNLGEAYLQAGNLQQARNHIDISLQLGREINFKNIILADLILLGQIELEAGMPEEAVAKLEEARALTNINTLRNELAEVHLWLCRAHEKLGNHKEALLNHQQFHKYHTEHHNELKVKEVRGAQFRQEIAELQSTTTKLEGTVSERTRQLENALSALEIREEETRELLDIEMAVNQFSQSLFLQRTVDGVVWDLAKNCIGKLGFEDAVIYMVDPQKTHIEQRAAHGAKNPIDFDIINPLSIPIGQGIVGTVARTGEYELISDTSLDPRYLVDDEARLSEIAVPIMGQNGEVIGVIDSEHRDRNFFKQKHLRILRTIAGLAANRIEWIRAQDEQQRLQTELIDQLRTNELLQTQVNRELEQKVNERTREIESAKLKIEAQAKDITDSISYARSIQEAMLPTRSQLLDLFPDNFVLYLPRDMVSGDFYWATERNDTRYFAVADCTGHGVPGALMSVLGIEKFEQALLVESEPGQILGHVNREVRKTLRQSLAAGASQSHGGMDAALISYTPATRTLKYAGAKRPLCLITDTDCQQVSATRHSVGSGTADDVEFEQHQFQLPQGGTIYLFSDGFADQFGGDDGRKFSSGRLRNLLHDNANEPLTKQHKELMRALHRWQGPHQQVDDILVVGIKFA